MSTSHSQLFVTTGEPVGIGADLLIKYVQQAASNNIVAVASQSLLKERAAKLGLPINLRPFHNETAGQQADQTPGLRIIDIPLQAPVTCGQLDPANAVYVLNSLRHAVKLCQQTPDSAQIGRAHV